MGHTAVMQFIEYFGKGKLVIQQSFFNPFNFMHDDVLQDSDAPDLRKGILEVGIIVSQFLTDVIRKILVSYFIGIMDHFNDRH